MDKGIRSGLSVYFMAQNELRRTGQAPYAGEKGNAAFRKAVIFWAVEQYGCSINAACTHYNTVFQSVKANPETAALVAGLGRPPEKNNGGRKKKVAPAAAAPQETGLTVADVVGSNILGSDGDEADEAEGEQETAPAEAPEQTVFKVCKKSDGTVVAEGLSFEDAKALVQKAADAKKAKLYWV